VQQTIREQLLNRKGQLLKAAYYDMARNETKVRTNSPEDRRSGRHRRQVSANPRSQTLAAAEFFQK
jgi:hypothetical protein